MGEGILHATQTRSTIVAPSLRSGVFSYFVKWHWSSWGSIPPAPSDFRSGMRESIPNLRYNDWTTGTLGILRGI